MVVAKERLVIGAPATNANFLEELAAVMLGAHLSFGSKRVGITLRRDLP
jgi:hypothetical protein